MKHPELFANQTEVSGAIFSPCRRYRYQLFRQWHTDLPKILFIGLNPSKADEIDDDPTITRVIKFAKSWGYGGIYMMNLFAFVSTDPDELVTSGEDLAENTSYLKTFAEKSQDVLFAWGAFKQAKERQKEIIDLFPDALCLKHTKDGSPWHPLYVAGKTKPIKFKQ